MSVFLDTRGRSKLAIAICARCSCKFPWDELVSDPNAPGLMVCRDDLDQLDPYRLAPRETEDITLEWARPDVSIADQGPWTDWTFSEVPYVTDTVPAGALVVPVTNGVLLPQGTIIEMPFDGGQFQNVVNMQTLTSITLVNPMPKRLSVPTAYAQSSRGPAIVIVSPALAQGYLRDGFGNLILDGNGLPIPLA